MGHSPQTGEAIKIPAKAVVRFRLARAFKEAVVLPKEKWLLQQSNSLEASSLSSPEAGGCRCHSAPQPEFINDAPACVVTCRDTKYYLEDGSGATKNILLTARMGRDAAGSLGVRSPTRRKSAGWRECPQATSWSA